MLCFRAAAHLARRDTEQAVGIHLESDADARRTRHHGRDAAQLELGQRTAIAHQFALALHHVDAHRGLSVLVGGEFLRACTGYRAVARDDLLDQAAHGLYAQTERNHVQQQPVVAAAIARQHVGLNGSTECHHLVRIEIVQRGLSK